MGVNEHRKSQGNATASMLSLITYIPVGNAADGQKGRFSGTTSGDLRFSSVICTIAKWQRGIFQATLARGIRFLYVQQPTDSVNNAKYNQP